LMAHSIITDTSLQGKDVPTHAIYVCVLVGGGGGGGEVLLHSYYWYWIEVTGWMNEERVFDTWQRQEGFLLSLPFAMALWPTRLLNGYAIKQRTGLTMHHHLVQKYNTWRLFGTITISSYIFLVWCVVKHRNNLTLNYCKWNSTAPFRLPK
jgi:hypothetical protein